MDVSLRRSEGQLVFPMESPDIVLGSTLDEVITAAVALGAPSFGGPLTAAEERLVRRVADAPLDAAGPRAAIRAGGDPLGEAMSAARPPEGKRALGAIYTPVPVVRSMLDWTLAREPSRLIDPGCGSGRFAAAAVRADRDIEVVAIDVDPVATLATRAALRCLDARRARVVHGDYTTLQLPAIKGTTAFVGNPPYVRHHQLSSVQKAWAKKAATRLELPWSGLAGLHALFFLATFLAAREGDIGCFITSAEWLDVAYGRGVREALLDGMGVEGVHRLDPRAVTFEDAMTTAVVTCFVVGSKKSRVRVRSVGSAAALRNLDSGGKTVPRAELRSRTRWTPVFVAGGSGSAKGLIPLSEIVRVSRGAVTGANRFFTLRPQEATGLGLMAWTVPVLTSADEVFREIGLVRATPGRRLLLDPPRDTDPASPRCSALRSYLQMGERDGVADGYICRHRNPWWHVGSKRPPIVATYMARQPPAFALNPDRMAMLNVFHGLFPKVELDDEQLAGLVAFLNAHRAEFRGKGRTYQGGLEKFEPSEMEALSVPTPGRLRRYART